MWTKEKAKAYREAHKEEAKAYYESHKKERLAQMKEYNQTHKEQIKAYRKIYHQTHKEQAKIYNQTHKEKALAYMKNDVNSLGEPKNNIRSKSLQYLRKYGHKIPGFEIHHCCTYTEPYKFIYCSREMHKLIHSYLRQHNIDADSDHYEQIKHLLDDTVVKYGID